LKSSPSLCLFEGLSLLWDSFLWFIVRFGCSVASTSYFHVAIFLWEIPGRFYRTREGPGLFFFRLLDDRQDKPAETLILPTDPGKSDIPCAVTFLPSRVIAVFVIKSLDVYLLLVFAQVDVNSYNHYFVEFKPGCYCYSITSVNEKLS
jgi:hypothetical protein